MRDVNVFVYGTLRRGDCRDRAMEGQMLWDEAFIDGFEMLDLGAFPGIVDGPADATVRGEVHVVPEEVLTGVLDRIEGYRPDAPTDGLYNRRIVEAYNEDGDCVDVWVYIYNQRRRPSATNVIPSGDWFEHRGLYEMKAGG